MLDGIQKPKGLTRQRSSPFHDTAPHPLKVKTVPAHRAYGHAVADRRVPAQTRFEPGSKIVATKRMRTVIKW